MIRKKIGRVVVVASRQLMRAIWTAMGWAGIGLLGDLEWPVVFRGPLRLLSTGGRISIGRATLIGPEVTIDCIEGARLAIGRHVTVNQGVYISALGSVVIGSHTRIGEYASIRDNDHRWRDPDKLLRLQGYVVRPVKIGPDVWIGRAASINKGVRIGRGAIVGAAAVVTRNVPPYAVVAGVPARIIGWRRAPEPAAEGARTCPAPAGE
jgi:acetyltransferase-like isoleucine patch superfamily enzyme